MKFLSHYQSSLLDLEKKCCRSKETETSKDIPGFKHHRKKKKKNHWFFSKKTCEGSSLEQSNLGVM